MSSTILLKVKQITQSLINNHSIPAILVAVFLGLTIFASQNDSLTLDETVHIPVGWIYAKYGIYKMNIEHPPLMKIISGIFLLPLNLHYPSQYPLPTEYDGTDQYPFGDSLLMYSENNMDKILFWGRLPAILMTTGLMIVIYIWTKKITNSRVTGILAMVLGMNVPIILAHGRLANTDAPLTFFYLLTFYFLWIFLEKPTFKYSILLGLSMGFALASKFSALIILPISILLILTKIFFFREKYYSAIKPLVLYVLSMILAVILVWGIYLGAQRNEIFNNNALELGASVNFRVADTLWEKIVFKPLDWYSGGLKFVINNLERYGYLNGDLRLGGHWNYFLYGLLYKTPLPMLILFLIGLFVASFQIYKKKDSFMWLFILLPFIIYLGISAMGKLNIGVRHIMPIYPFMVIVSTMGVWTLSKKRNNLVKISTIFFVLWLMVDIAIHYPSFMGYFSQVIGSNHNNYKYLFDSDVDWLQDDQRMIKYLKSQSIGTVYMANKNKLFVFWDIDVIEINKNSEKPPSGSYVVLSSNDKAWANNTNNAIDWIVKNKSPIHHIGYSIYLYKI